MIERHKATWVVRGFMEFIDVHFYSDGRYAPIDC